MAAKQTGVHNLFSKADIAKVLGYTTQGLANTISRDPNFPKPSYSNASGDVALYSKEDVVAIHEHLTKAERERLDRLNKAMEELSKSAEPEAPAKPKTSRGQKAAAQPEPEALEGQSTIEDATQEEVAAQ